MILKLINSVFITTLTLLIVWGLGWMWFATNIALAEPEQEIKSVDAIIVLTGGNGRINAGLNLLNKKVAPKLFISGVSKNVTEEEVLKNWKKYNDTTPCCITLGFESTDTISNATEVEDWVQKNNVHSILLVTSSYHMPRATMEIKQRLPKIEITEYPVLSSDFKAWQGRFWVLSFSEYNKSLLRWMQKHKTQNPVTVK